jgi:hypothetical protein
MPIGLNEDSQETDVEAGNEEGIREEAKEIESPDDNERIKDGFEWQEDR